MTPESTRTLLSFLIVMLLLILSGAAWGRGMARLIEAGEPRRMTWAGMGSFGPAVILAALILGRLEVLVVEQGVGPALPAGHFCPALEVKRLELALATSSAHLSGVFGDRQTGAFHFIAKGGKISPRAGQNEAPAKEER